MEGSITTHTRACDRCGHSEVVETQHWPVRWTEVWVPIVFDGIKAELCLGCAAGLYAWLVQLGRRFPVRSGSGDSVGR